MLEFAPLIFAGFAAGLLNSVAGGGTFFTLPALIYSGVPPVVANATSTLVVLPGYVSSAWAFRRDIETESALSLKSIIAISTIGSVLGAGFLIITPNDAFLWLIPWLLLVSTAAFAAGPAVTRALQHRSSKGVGPIATGAGILLVSIYGGYFNGGLGIMLLALFSLLGFKNLHGMNGLKTLLSALLSAVSVAVFIVGDLITWELALPMAVSAAIGGYLGALFSRRVKNTDLLRAFVTLVGMGMTVVFFIR